jgi:hypothetical protein
MFEYGCKEAMNHWTVLSEAPSRNGRKRVLCRCVCGREREVYESALRAGRSRSCGCRNGSNLSGMLFGSLTALHPARRADGVKVWVCSCVCGKETLVRAQSLKSGHTTSCGCGGTDNTREVSCEYCGTLTHTERCEVCTRILSVLTPKKFAEWIAHVRVRKDQE